MKRKTKEQEMAELVEKMKLAEGYVAAVISKALAGLNSGLTGITVEEADVALTDARNTLIATILDDQVFQQ